MAEEKDIALLADNDIIVEIEVQESPTVIVESPHTTTAEISGDSAIGFVVSALPTLAKEATLLAKVAELKEALNSIDFTAIEQAIQGVEDVTAKEATLIQGVEDIIKAVENIDFTELENSIAEVKNAVVNIDLSPIAKEETLTQVHSKVEEVKEAVSNIDLSSVGNKVEEESNAIQEAIQNIKLPEIDTTELASKNLERFFGVKPIDGYEFMTPEEVCSELEEIMTTMDIDLTPEMATNITQNTLKQFGNE